MTSRDFIDNVIISWDLAEQEARTKFLDYLYDFFGCTDGLYTGLWTLYKEVWPYLLEIKFWSKISS